MLSNVIKCHQNEFRVIKQVDREMTGNREEEDKIKGGIQKGEKRRDYER